MAKVKVYYSGSEGNKIPYRVGFICPGCGEHHLLPTEQINGGDKAIWGFNGDFDKPTFTPSILMCSGHYIPGYKDECWCTYKKEHPESNCPKCGICHSFVTYGQIRFLNDCTHELAGQLVELPEIE